MSLKNMVDQFSNVLILLILCSSFNSYADSCKWIINKNQFSSVIISESGKYCLKGDIKLEKYLVLSEGRYKGEGYILDTSTTNVELDLKKHVLQNAHKYAGGLLLDKKNILIRNGELKIKGQYADGIKNSSYGYAYFSILGEDSESEACSVKYPPCVDVSYLNSINKKQPTYKDTYLTIEEMRVYLSYQGVVLGGNYNVIRDSVIEVDDNNAIFLLGQYPIVENNTIIIHSKKNNNAEFRKKWGLVLQDGAIKLRDAKGGIIRNNKIIYKGGWFSWGKAPVAINLLDSKGVIVEGNTVEGFEQLVRENGDTSFTEKNNTLQ